MSSLQTSLLSGDVLSQHRFDLMGRLQEALDVVRLHVGHDPEVDPLILEQALAAVRVIADELRLIGCPTETVPF